MAEPIIHVNLKKILLSKRMISVKNLINLLSSDIQEIHQLLKQFEKCGYIRIAQPGGCGAICSSCNTCTTNNQSNITENTTIISLLFTRAEEDVN